MTNEITKSETQIDSNTMEAVLLGGDLSKLNPQQRLSYYKNVCESLGLNPLTRPFEYIMLNGKVTLYAKKDTTDQLRKIHAVSIDDVEITETADQYVVKVKGHDKTGRSDVEIGVVNKKDMRGDTANSQMKAVTKAKRRLTLSICGLGWLDETEVQTIPDAKPVEITDDGEILSNPENISQETGEANDAIELINPMDAKWVTYAAEKWNVSAPEAAKEIGSKKLGSRIDKNEFIQIVTGQPE